MGIQPVQVLTFIDSALSGMLGAVAQLGDERVNLKPALPGANSPYAIVYHSVQVAHWWIGMMGAGRTMERDRDSEFVATGTVADLEAVVADLRRQLATDIAEIEPQAPLRHFELFPVDSTARHWTQGEALVHAYEELAQHLGQLEITRDLLLSQRR